MRTMKEDAAEAIPDLVQALRNDPRQWLAAPAILAGMGHGVVPELKKLMPSDDQEVSGDIEATMKRQFPLHVLGEMKPLSPETVAILLRVLEGKNDSDRGFAWSALGKNATDITPLLVRALRHENPRVRAGAAAALDYTRDVKSPEIVPALIESLRDTDVAARYRAAKALKRINPKAAQSAGAEAVIARHCGLEESD
jgi:HEAT repeat protein